MTDPSGQGWRILLGDCRARLAELPADHFHCCVTSPPYFGLRDYGTGRWEGGDAACDHKNPKIGMPTWGPGSTGSSTLRGRPTNDSHSKEAFQRHECPKCGARRIDQQIGSEQTLAEYVATMVAVFEEVRRVLRPDGTLWLNLGDTYNAGTSSKRKAPKTDVDVGGWNDAEIDGGARIKADGMKPKDLMGVPWRVALALQAAGWWLRSDIPWVKRSAMPESVNDRPAKALEYVFLLTKSQRYYFDMDAIRRPVAEATLSRDQYSRILENDGPQAVRHDHESTANPAGRNFRNADLWFESVEAPHGLVGIDDELVGLDVTSSGFKEAHFATFPLEFVEPLIKAGTSERGCCPKCGGPWRRVMQVDGGLGKSWHDHSNDMIDGNSRLSVGSLASTPQTRTLVGWRPICKCDAGEPEPCRVLDPFAGSGTSLMVARRLGRYATGCELSDEYAKMAARRIREDQPLLNR